MGVFHACSADGLGSVLQAPQDAGGVSGIQMLQDFPGDAENGPVVDVENGGPGLNDLALRVGYTVIADLRERTDACVHTGDLVVEDEGVGDDGAGHAAGLAHIGHAQQGGYFRGDAETGPVYLVEELGRGVDAFLQSGGCLVHSMLGDGDEAHHVGQVLDASVQPAGLGEALGATVLAENTVRQAGL